MSKTVYENFANGHLKLRYFGGTSSYWENGNDQEATTTYPGNWAKQAFAQQISDFPANTYNNYEFQGSYLMTLDSWIDNTHRMGRLLFEWDLSTVLPANAVVTGATLLFWINGMNSVSATNTPAFYPCTLAVYRVTRVPTMASTANSGALMHYYAPSTGAWGVWGMQDGVDYATPAVGTCSLMGTDVSPNVSSGVYKSIDITSLAQYAAQTDDRRMRFILSRSDAHRRSFANPGLYGGGGLSIGVVATGNSTGTPMTLSMSITYNEPLTIHPADGTGVIDETVFIDSSIGHYYVLDSIRAGGAGIARKFFVKNRLTSSVGNVKVFSQRSRAGKAHEMVRTGEGNGSIYSSGAEPTTVDKSSGVAAYTRNERFQIRLTSSSAFSVFRDNGTYDDPTVADAYSAASPATGTVGTLYTETNRGVGFTVVAGGTAFVNGDIIEFKTYQDDATTNAPYDSDQMLRIAPDSGNTPGSFRPIMIKPTNVSSAVSGNTVVPLVDTSLYISGMQVMFTNRVTGATSLRGVDTVGPTSITVDSSITLGQYDYAEGVAVGVSSLAALGTLPFWIQPVAPDATSRETKYPWFRAQAD